MPVAEEKEQLHLSLSFVEGREGWKVNYLLGEISCLHLFSCLSP